MSDESDLVGPDDGGENITDEQMAEFEAAMAEARASVLAEPAETIVVNHVVGLYELAAIHLSADEPDLAAASLAVDAMALLVDGLGDRLGDGAAPMRDALGNIRMAFVSVTNRLGGHGSAD